MDESLKLPDPSFPSLYERTGDIKDINSLLANRAELRAFGLTCARAALEEAAKVCEMLNHDGQRYAAVIRNIKVGE